MREVHTDLRPLVWWQREDLVLRRPGSTMAMIAPWLFGGFVCAFAMMLGLVFVTGGLPVLLFVLFALPFLAIAFLVMLMLSVRGWIGHKIRATPDGVHSLQGEWEPGPLRVIGKPGCRMAVWVGPRELFAAIPSHRGPWSFDAMSWYAATLAQLWQQPLDDQRDAQGWERWTADPEVRAASQFERSLDDNFYTWRSYHEVPPSELDAAHEHHGVTYGVHQAVFGRSTLLLGVSATHLTHGSLSVPLVDIARVYALYLPSSKGRRMCQINLLMRDGRVLKLFRTLFHNSQLEHCGRMNAVPRVLARHIAEARAPESAQTGVVPAALRVLTQNRKET